MPDDLEYWGCGICIIIWPNSNSFRNILVQLNMVTTKDSILNTLLQCYKIHNLSTYSVVFNYFVFICYKQCFKKQFSFFFCHPYSITSLTVADAGCINKPHQKSEHFWGCSTCGFPYRTSPFTQSFLTKPIVHDYHNHIPWHL